MSETSFSKQRPSRSVRRRGELLEALEPRILLSWMPTSHRESHVRAPAPKPRRAHTTAILKALQPRASSPNGNGLMAAQVRSAYGIDQVMFGNVVGDGAGQTVAIIDAFHYPTALADLQQFDAAMGVADLEAWSSSGNTGPWFRVVSQTGGTNYPTTQSGSSTWEMEEALDIQWVHAMAPGANIILVEANSATDSNLLTAAVGWARTQPGVSAVSMSFSQAEGGFQTTYDSLFTTPSGHTGMTFLAATGDAGQPSGYPAFSPNVVAVGGTTLSVAGGAYVSESGWSGSGGSLSTVYTQPSYQTGVVTQSTSARANPDVAMLADPNTGVWIYDSYDFPSSPWQVFGGTSLATPMWAGIMAIANQGRVLGGLTPLDGRTQTLPKLYALPASDFHDITTGNNGFAAGPGYDLVTGRGSPVANLLIADLVTPPSATPGTPALAAASDSGVSNTDKITALDNSSVSRTLTFTVSGTIPGATVGVFADGHLIGSAVAGDTSTDVTTNGTYALASGTHAMTATQTQPGLSQSGPSAALSITVDTTPVTVAAQTPSGSTAGAQIDLKLTFNKAIDTTSFSLADVVSFTDPGNNDVLGQITGTSWSGGNTVLDIQFNAQSAVGSYQLVLGPQIQDLAGNAMASSYTAGFTIISAIYAATMDSNPGWTLDAGSPWAWGVPTGGGSHNGDPSSGHTGSNVIGYNLSGDYSRNSGPYYATTPAIDCTNYKGMTLSFWRWLGARSSATANVQASSDGGTTWTTLWSNSGTTISDAAWSQQSFMLPASFDGKSAVKFRWGMGPTGGGNSTYPGWNIDDVLVTGAPNVLATTISGQVFVDANGSGTLDSGEGGLAGASVFLDLNGNGVADSGEPLTTTNAAGNYSFDVAAGTYWVREVLPANYVAVAGVTHSVTASTSVTGQNFANFPTSFAAVADGDSYYVTASAGVVQISSGGVPLQTPTWQIAAALLPGLTFTLNGMNQTLILDFGAGLPLGVDLTVNGVEGNNGLVKIMGQGSDQAFTMTDFTIGLAAGSGVIHYNTVDGMDLNNCNVNYSGSLSTLQNLIIDSGCLFNWS